MDSLRLAYAKEKWEKRLSMLGKRKDALAASLDKLEGEERAYAIYLLATLPISDLTNYGLEDLLPFIRHSLMLREKMPWTKALSEDYFIDFVLYPRINTENIEDCRGFFYEELLGYLKEGDWASDQELALAVNYWCQEQVTYQMADDRTASAMTTYCSGSGRCGEESTFAVNALRSVGIPSRQVYAPWWSHCDDNHAWVEIFVGGEWHFMGACEPQPILDYGWFTNAASRAMIVHGRTFTGACDQEDLIRLYGPERAYYCHVEEGVTYEHVTHHYAKVRPVKVRCVSEEGERLPHAKVFFEVLNMAIMAPVAVITCDRSGEAQTELGLGSIRLHAVLEVSGEVWFAEKDLIIQDLAEAEVVLTLHKISPDTFSDESYRAFDTVAAKDYPMHPHTLTYEMRKERERVTDLGTKTRLSRLESYYDPQRAGVFSEAMQEVLKLSYGNFSEIIEFLEESALGDLPYREKLLLSLRKKDLRDITKKVLTDHLIFAMPYHTDYADEIFVPYVLCPRISDEMITAYRLPIDSAFSDSEKKAFVKHPESLWAFLSKQSSIPEADYHELFYHAEGSLESGMTSEKSRAVAFVAILRTLGLAARLNPVTKAPEYLKTDTFATPYETQEEASLGELVLSAQKSEDWIYHQTFGLSHLKNGVFESLHLPAMTDRSMIVFLKEGVYRLLTVNRLPNGHIAALEKYFRIRKGEQKEIELSLRDVDLLDTLSSNPISPFELQKTPGVRESAASLLSQKTNLLLWLEEGKEPTEHILNEMMARKEAFQSLKAGLFFILRDEAAKEQTTLKMALEAFPNATVLYDDFRDNVSILARRMYVDQSKLPLILVLHDGLTGIFADSGYRVGMGEILLRIVEALTGDRS